MFYKKVLPADLVSARRTTYASLPALARKAAVRYEARTTSLEDLKKDSHLRHMTIRMTLQGDYRTSAGSSTSSRVPRNSSSSTTSRSRKAPPMTRCP